MNQISNLSYLTSTLIKSKERLKEIATPVKINNDSKYITFISLGNHSLRAKVFCEVGDTFEKMYRGLEKKATRLVKKQHFNPEWIKIDIVSNIEKMTFKQLEALIANTRRNYFRNGIAFDSEFKCAVLEQEINGNALIRELNNHKPALNDININNYFKQKYSNHILFMKNHYIEKDVYLFQTKAIFIDREKTETYNLYNGLLTNGLRQVSNIKQEVHQIIHQATEYLTKQVKENGMFHYGYFSAFSKSIGTYNILRHSSSLYSMIEGFEVTKDENTLKAVKQGLTYLIETAIHYKGGSSKNIAFVVDHANEAEIKLGSNATAILAMTKYMEVTGDDCYLKIAQDLARGIIDMKLPDNGFIHVLEYPTLRIKAMNRIIYYEGEAIFSLLRLYALDKDNCWLDEIKDSFDYFIKNNYWKHHDHWLSYATNELTLYEPKDKYFIFGLKNCNNRLEFIYNRETTFPTFLELTMACYKMIDRIKVLNKTYLLDHIDEDVLRYTVDHRAEFQRVGFFYPEQAMYMKYPKNILHGFFIRHHSFRVRIDDVEHYLSGYCQYFHYRIPDLETKQLPLLNI